MQVRRPPKTSLQNAHAAKVSLKRLAEDRYADPNARVAAEARSSVRRRLCNEGE